MAEPGPALELASIAIEDARKEILRLSRKIDRAAAALEVIDELSGPAIENLLLGSNWGPASRDQARAFAAIKQARAILAEGKEATVAEPPRPRAIFFFPNGTAGVCDQNDDQMSQYQTGWHGTTIAALAADGIDWREIPERHGTPDPTPPAWWLERQRTQEAGHA